jgi:4-amino-4-deoxy-L-arabinose transferase-like glycosyltransferase
VNQQHQGCRRQIIFHLSSDISKGRDKNRTQMKNDKWRMRNGKCITFVGLLIVAASFRLAVVHWLPNDAPDDGRVYAQIARNVLEQHVYSHETQAPYDPSLIRLPGYPLFLAGIYSIFGHANNAAVRIAQALIDTATCALIALLAFYWQPNESRKRASALAALALAAVCPFTAIYAATILTEVPTNFLAIATVLAATLAFRAQTLKRSCGWWLVAGLIGGIAVLFRPDSGLLAAAIGLTLVVTTIWSAVASTGVPGAAALGWSSARHRFGLSKPSEVVDPKRRCRFALPAHSKQLGGSTLLSGGLFSLAFVLILAPWTIRNWRVFHLFQPLAPAHAEMPGEFVPRGYNLWLRTWLDDGRYVEPFLWSLDSAPIDIEEAPPSAFDSGGEKNRVAALFDRYNNPDAQPEVSGQNDNSSDQNSEDNQSVDQSEEPQTEEPASVEMTPEIDAGFAQLARERIARHPIRFYLWLPIKRARSMWFDTHSQYWPFEGELLPLEDLDYGHQQQFWLPLFAGLTGLYTALGLAGGWLWWRSRQFEARRWFLLAALAIILRLILFSSIENPEPRYLVEFFPFLAILGGIAIAGIPKAFAKVTTSTS